MIEAILEQPELDKKERFEKVDGVNYKVTELREVVDISNINAQIFELTQKRDTLDLQIQELQSILGKL